MIHIASEAHTTALDNEIKCSSDWYDVELSPLELEHAKELDNHRRILGYNVFFDLALNISMMPSL